MPYRPATVTETSVIEGHEYPVGKTFAGQDQIPRCAFVLVLLDCGRRGGRRADPGRWQTHSPARDIRSTYRLPIPPLEDTMKRYLKALEGLQVSADTFGTPGLIRTTTPPPLREGVARGEPSATIV